MIWRIRPLALGLALLVAPLAAGAQLGSAEDLSVAQEMSRFERTVIYLRGADDALRTDFAVLAIDRLRHVYTAEAELARDEYSRDAKDVELLGWSSAVEQYAAQLPELAREVEQGAAVLLSGGGIQGVAMQVDGRMVLLVHPRPDQQEAFERDLLQLFCARQPCEEFTPGLRPASAIPVSRARVEPDWTFTAKGAVCAYAGIKLVFGQRTSISGLRRLCRNLFHELLTLSDEIAWQARHAVVVDWERLSIAATVRRPEHRVQLNVAGDSVLIAAPILQASPGLLMEVAPWIKARLAGGEVLLELDAPKYGWK